MLYVIVFGLLMALLFIMGIQKNKYSIAFFISFTSLCIMVFASSLSILNFSNYRSVIQLDSILYWCFSKIEISYYDLKTIINIGMAGIFTGLFVLSMVSAPQSTSKIKTLLKIGGFLFLLAIWFFANSTDFGEQIFLWRHHESPSVRKLSAIAEAGVHISDWCIIILTFIMPYFSSISGYRATHLLLEKKRIKTTILCFTALELLFFAALFFSPIFQIIHNLNMFDFEQFGIWEYNLIFNIIFPPAFIVIITIACIVLLRFKIFDIFIAKNLAIKKANLRLYDLRCVLHTFKNYAAIIISLEKAAESNYGNTEGLESLNKIKDTAFEFSEQVGYLINIYNKPKLNFEKLDVTECLKNVTKKLDNPSVKVSIFAPQQPLYVFADVSSFSEMCYNIAQNAADAIAKENPDEGEIIINIFTENNMVCISFWDNGGGMDRKTKKNIFKPFVSTKNTFNHWGLGMSQVYNAVKAHYGYIDIDSKLNKTTEIQVVFPQYL